MSLKKSESKYMEVLTTEKYLELVNLVRGAWDFVPNEQWRKKAEKHMEFKGE